MDVLSPRCCRDIHPSFRPSPLETSSVQCMTLNALKALCRCVHFSDDWEEEGVDSEDNYSDIQAEMDRELRNNRKKFSMVEDACNKRWQAWDNNDPNPRLDPSSKQWKAQHFHLRSGRPVDFSDENPSIGMRRWRPERSGRVPCRDDMGALTRHAVEGAIAQADAMSGTGQESRETMVFRKSFLSRQFIRW